MDKEYLGDSVYAHIEEGVICLTVENGEFVSSTIFLEREVIEALISYVDRSTGLSHNVYGDAL
jgi:hypothetical protein